MKKKSSFPNKHRRLMWMLTFLIVAMFGFTYALVPLYNVLCKTIGLNGKTSTTVAPLETQENMDTKRIITVEFVASRNANLPMQFYPLVNKVKVHPGENKRVAFFAENNTNHAMTIQAVPSVTPGEAAQYLRKTECFCFTQQVFKGKQALDMPLIFHLDKEIPAKIRVITLSYTLFDVSNIKPSNNSKSGKIS